jgi:hypothetical protein
MQSRLVRLGALSLLLALLGALAPVAPALAVPDQNPPTAEDILEDCLVMIDELTTDVEEAIEVQTAATIAQINAMRAAGDSEKQLKKTAKRGKKDLSNTARSGLAELNRITGSCMIQMRRIGSDRTLNNTLLAARSASFQAMKDAANAGGDLIDAALAGEPPVAPDETPEDFQGTPL